MSTNVLTFTWLIMGHGKVIRYAKNPGTMEFNPNLVEFNTNPNIRYLSMSLPQDEAEAFPANGWQAINSVFKSIDKSVNSMTQIEDLCEYYENYAHYNNPLWTIYNGNQPWEKYFTGYVDKEEEETWKRNINRVEFNAGDNDFADLVTVGEGRRGSTHRHGLFSAALDPVCTSARPYSGNAFCRLMFINIYNRSQNYNQNIYYGDKTMCTKNSKLNEDDYGFKIPNGLMSLSEIREKCFRKSVNEKNEMGYNNDDCNVFIYDSTCNSYDVEISRENETRMIERNKRKKTEEINKLRLTGGTNFENNEIDFFQKIREQSERMANYAPNIDDKNNFINALEFVTTWSARRRGGEKINNGRKKTKRKDYKKTNKNNKSKKQQKTRTRNNRKTIK
jgi:hypothetical protein